MRIITVIIQRARVTEVIAWKAYKQQKEEEKTQAHTHTKKTENQDERFGALSLSLPFNGILWSELAQHLYARRARKRQ